MTEYKALNGGLAIELEVKILDIFGDSQLMVKQLNGEFKAHNERMTAYLALSVDHLQKISLWQIMNIERDENQWVDALSKLASPALPSEEEPIYVEERTLSALKQPSLNEIQNSVDWCSPILNYIFNSVIP